MKFKFIGVPGETHNSITMYGQQFPLGRFVEETRGFVIRKLSNHPHFEVKAGGEMEDAHIAGANTLTPLLSPDVVEKIDKRRKEHREAK